MKSLLLMLLTFFVTSKASGPIPMAETGKARPCGDKAHRGADREAGAVSGSEHCLGMEHRNLHVNETHEYVWVRDRYMNTLLSKVARVKVVSAMDFPSKEQWEKADLIVFYLWTREKRQLELWDCDLIDAYQKRGSGLIFIHMALMEGSGERLAKRIGLAWDHRRTKWGVLPTPVTLTEVGAKSPILSDLRRS